MAARLPFCPVTLSVGRALGWFRIPFTGYRGFRSCRNLKSATDNLDFLKVKIGVELSACRVAGPFDELPFPTLRLSPLGLVPKKKPGEFRVIHHLSYPEHDSVNDGIPRDMCTVCYQTIDDAVSLVKRTGYGTLLAETDIEAGFRLIPFHPDDLLGFQIDGKFYFDKTLPMDVTHGAKFIMSHY